MENKRFITLIMVAIVLLIFGFLVDASIGDMGRGMGFMLFSCTAIIIFSSVIGGYVEAFLWKPKKIVKSAGWIGAGISFLVSPVVFLFAFAVEGSVFWGASWYYKFIEIIFPFTLLGGLFAAGFGAWAGGWAAKTEAKELREKTIKLMKGYEGNGNYEWALQSLEKLKEIDESLGKKEEYPEDWVLTGNSYYMQGEFNRALECYENALKMEPTNRMAISSKQNLLQVMNKEKKAKAEGFERAGNYTKAAELYDELGMWDDARRCRGRLSAAPEYVPEEMGQIPPPPISHQQVQNVYKEYISETALSSLKFGDFFSYRIQHKIGSGGFSDVYLVERAGKQYAMKIPKGVDLKGSDTLELREEDLEGYGKEAEIWATLTEKEPDAVVNLVDAGIRPFPWFVMEIADSELRRAAERMSNREKIEVSMQLLEKLDRIHHYGIVHKDLKPENILHTGGEWKFTDFGLSKILNKSSKSSQMLSGTMKYMAPEQVSKKKFGNTDWRTDIWQMGVVIYEMLTGHMPFEEDDAGELAMAIIMEEPAPATRYGVDERVWNAIKKALEKRKEDRWQSATDFKNALLSAQGGQT